MNLRIATLTLCLAALTASPVALAKRDVNIEKVGEAIGAVLAGDNAKASAASAKAIRDCRNDRACIYGTQLALTRGYSDAAQWGPAVYRGKQAVTAAKRLGDDQAVVNAYAYYAIALAGADKMDEAKEAVEDGLNAANQVDIQFQGKRLPVELLMGGAQAIIHHKQGKYAEAAQFQARFVEINQMINPNNPQLGSELLLLANLYAFAENIQGSADAIRRIDTLIKESDDEAYKARLAPALQASLKMLEDQKVAMFIKGCLPVFKAYDEMLLMTGRAMLPRDAVKVFELRQDTRANIDELFATMTKADLPVNERAQASNLAFSVCKEAKDKLTEAGVEYQVVQEPRKPKDS